MSRKNVNFGGKKIKQSKFYKIKEVIKIDHIDVKKILVSKEEPYGSKNSFKYFIGYIEDDAIKHYVYSFHKWLDMLEILMVTERCLLRSVLANC